MKRFAAKFMLGSLLFVSLFSFMNLEAQSGALVHTVITGRVIALNYYHGRLVRFTVRRLSGIQSQRYVVTRPDTKVYYQGREGENPRSYEIIRKGMVVRAEGGLATFGDRIVADKIVILKRW